MITFPSLSDIVEYGFLFVLIATIGFLIACTIQFIQGIIENVNLQAEWDRELDREINAALAEMRGENISTEKSKRTDTMNADNRPSSMDTVVTVMLISLIGATVTLTLIIIGSLFTGWLDLLPPHIAQVLVIVAWVLAGLWILGAILSFAHFYNSSKEATYYQEPTEYPEE